MKSDEQQAVRGFIADKNKADDIKTEMLLQQTLNQVGRGRRPLWVLILLCVLALVAAPLLTLLTGTKWLVPALVACIAWELCSAKNARMRRLWQEHEPGGEGVTEALKRMYFTALRSPLAAADKVKLGVMLAVLALFAVLWALPEPAPSEAKLLAEKVGEVTGGKAVMADALALLADAEHLEGLETIQQAMKYTAYGSDEEFLLAVLMWMHIETRPDLMVNDYATGSAGTPMYDALKNTVPAQIDNTEEIAALGVLLKYAGTHQEAALTRFLQQNTLPEGLLAAFGSAMQADRTLPELLSLCDEIAAAGHDPMSFLTPYAQQLTLSEATQLIAQTDDAHRLVLIRAYAPALTDPDDVLAFLRLAGEYGLSAVDCYPQGALLDWDTSAFDPLSMNAGQAPSEDATFLFIRRTEKPEPYKTIVITPENDYWEDEFTGTDWMDYDPDAELGAAAYTVTLDTFLMSILPPERAAQSIADCDVLVITDLYYLCEGAVRFTRTAYRGNTMNTYDGNKWGDTVVDTPLYSALHNVSLYTMADRQLLFSYADKVVEAPYHSKSHELSQAESMADWNALEMYLPKIDEEWLGDASLSLVDTLRRKDWDVNRITIKYLWK